MDIKKISKILPKLTSNELNQISSKGLNNFFYLHRISAGEVFIPKPECIYFIEDGDIKVSIFLENNMEFNMTFSQGDSLGRFQILQEEGLDSVIEGRTSTTLLEIPIQKLLNKADIKFILSIYEEMIINMSKNILRLFKAYAAKVSYSNEQYFINYLISSGGFINYNSTEELALLIHIDIRTLQRIIKKLQDENLIKKSGKTLTVVDINGAKERIMNY